MRPTGNERGHRDDEAQDDQGKWPGGVERIAAPVLNIVGGRRQTTQQEPANLDRGANVKPVTPFWPAQELTSGHRIIQVGDHLQMAHLPNSLKISGVGSMTRVL